MKRFRFFSPWSLGTIFLFTAHLTAAGLEQLQGDSTQVMLGQATLRDVVPACGNRGSAPGGSEERAARRLVLERSYHDGTLGHCAFALARACQEWESGPPGAAWPSFDRAARLCDDATIGWRGKVASRLDREDFLGAYADWVDGTEHGPVDSAALAPYAASVHAGLSLTSFPHLVPATLRLPPPSRDPEHAFRLSVMPGAGFLYANEPALAWRHFILGASLTGLVAWRVHAGLTATDRGEGWTAGLDAAAITLLLWKRYQVGGMHEARRKLREKNRRDGGSQVRALWMRENPFAPEN